MEIDPAYADCICRRFEDYTGKAAVLADDGRTFGQVARERGEKLGHLGLEAKKER